MNPSVDSYDIYLHALISRIEQLAEKYPRNADTLYIGGGTPSLIGGDRLSEIIHKCRDCFGLYNAEITVECNPRSSNGSLFEKLAAAGVNRISIGMQSANPDELRMLGRRHSADDAGKTVEAARSAGISNISLDLMIGTPAQTIDSLMRSAEYCISLDVPHISAYILKIEEGTPFANGAAELCPDGDTISDMYEQLCILLEQAGLNRYEISNFAKSGFESQHNLKYWRCEEYLGIGPAAHSFIDGQRMYYPRSLTGFISGENGGEPLFDSYGGSFEEYAMLRLRLREGLDLNEISRLYPGHMLPESELSLLCRGGFIDLCDNRVSLTAKGALVSNEIICRLIFSSEDIAE